MVAEALQPAVSSAVVMDNQANFKFKVHIVALMEQSSGEKPALKSALCIGGGQLGKLELKVSGTGVMEQGSDDGALQLWSRAVMRKHCIDGAG
eukprot:1150584-Pelagomonas_calceolata.AAC.1